MKPVVIFGNGSFARLLYAYVDDAGERTVEAFVTEEKYINPDEKEINEKPIICIDDLVNEYPSSEVDVLIGVGYSKMNAIREHFFNEIKQLGYNIASFIHPTAYISPNAIVGEGNIILEFSMLAPSSIIGCGNILWDYVSIAHDCHVGNFNLFSGNAGLSGFTTVGNNCFLGKHCYTEDDVRISDYSLVGAGAGVKKNTKPYEVIVPARSITLQNKKSTDFL